MKWIHWKNRNQILDIRQPGIYFIAYSLNDMSNHDFKFQKEIVYIGMSISKKGVLGRLYQFKRAMEGKNGIHGGAERVRFKHKNYLHFFENCYLYVDTFVLSEKDEVFNWKQKGECVKQEYVSFANYFEKHGELPEFNDQKRSKKK